MWKLLYDIKPQLLQVAKWVANTYPRHQPPLAGDVKSSAVMQFLYSLMFYISKIIKVVLIYGNDPAEQNKYVS